MRHAAGKTEVMDGAQLSRKLVKLLWQCLANPVLGRTMSIHNS